MKNAKLNIVGKMKTMREKMSMKNVKLPLFEIEKENGISIFRVAKSLKELEFDDFFMEFRLENGNPCLKVYEIAEDDFSRIKLIKEYKPATMEELREKYDKMVNIANNLLHELFEERSGKNDKPPGS